MYWEQARLPQFALCTFNVILVVYLPPLAAGDGAKLITLNTAPAPRAALIALIETRILISKQFVDASLYVRGRRRWPGVKRPS